MAWNLYQLGRWCFRHRGRVVAGWLALLVLGGVGAATLSGKTNDNFELPGTESSQAFDLIKERTPQAAADGATARVVFQAPEGEQVTARPTSRLSSRPPSTSSDRPRRLHRRPVHAPGPSRRTAARPTPSSATTGRPSS